MASGSDGSAAARLLVVDDDQEITELLRLVLGSEGHEVRVAQSVEEASRVLTIDPPDLVLLDVGLGDGDGRELLAEIRRTSEVPVIMLTARAGEYDRVAGLKLGADDYVAKPFSPAELAARVGSVLRRTQASSRAAGAEAGVLDLGRLRIDPGSREVVRDGSPVQLTAREFDLLLFLARAPRQVLSRDQLLEHVWGSRSDWQDPATVTEHVRRLRKKLEDDPDHPRWITTVRGVGYRFVP